MGYFLGKAKFTHQREVYYSFVALGVATVFHGSYDYFWFIASVENIWAGVWIGAIISLIVAIVLSRRAIRIHQQASPFIKQAPVVEQAIDYTPPPEKPVE